MLAKTEVVMYRFVDDQFNGMFASEALISELSRVFASLAIIISCLDLFGLAAYTVERRIKEIGIRKVLGASGIAVLLSRNFLQLVGLSVLVAFPLAYWLIHNWLMDYAYHTTVQWWVFAVAGVLALLITLATVSLHALRAARANPVKNLRME